MELAPLRGYSYQLHNRCGPPHANRAVIAAHAGSSSSQTRTRRGRRAQVIDLHRRMMDGYSVLDLGLSFLIISGNG